MRQRSLTWIAVGFPVAWLLAAAITVRGLGAPNPLPDGATITLPRLPLLLLRSHSLLLYGTVVLAVLLLGLRRRPVPHRVWMLASGGLALATALAEWYYLYPRHAQFGQVLFGWLLSIPGFLCLCTFTWLYYLYATTRPRAWVLVPVAITVLPLFLSLVAGLSPGLPLEDMTSLRLPGGRTFHVLNSPRGNTFYSEERYVLAEQLSQTPFWLRVRVLGQAEGPAADAVLVRPAHRIEYALPPARPLGLGNVGAENRSRGKLVLSADRRTLLFLHPFVTSAALGQGAACTFAYELEQKQFSPDDAYADVAAPPFLLVGAHDALNEDDVVFLQGLLAAPHSEGFPTPAALAQSASHPNPRVRAVVATLRKQPAHASP